MGLLLFGEHRINDGNEEGEKEKDAHGLMPALKKDRGSAARDSPSNAVDE